MKIKLKINKKLKFPLLVALAIVILVVIILLFVKFLNRDLETFEVVDTEMYQYFGEQRFDYTTNMTINNKNEIKNLKVDGKEVVFFSEPFYYKEERKVLFPIEMSLIVPSSNMLQARLPVFTVLDGTILQTYLKNANLNYYIDDAIIFDGNNLYFFPFESILKIDGVEHALTAFSFVTVDPLNKECVYYDYENDIAKTVEYTKEVSAVVNNLTLNLSVDSIVINGKQRLLIKDLKHLDLLSN